jgi:hypothetical protein
MSMKCTVTSVRLGGRARGRDALPALAPTDYSLLVGGGYEIIVNGVPRSFRDKQATAYDAARLIKARWPNDLVQIRKPDGSTVTILQDGRTV